MHTCTCRLGQQVVYGLGHGGLGKHCLPIVRRCRRRRPRRRRRRQFIHSRRCLRTDGPPYSANLHTIHPRRIKQLVIRTSNIVEYQYFCYQKKITNCCQQINNQLCSSLTRKSSVTSDTTASMLSTLLDQYADYYCVRGFMLNLGAVWLYVYTYRMSPLN